MKLMSSMYRYIKIQILYSKLKTKKQLKFYNLMKNICKHGNKRLGNIKKTGRHKYVQKEVTKYKFVYFHDRIRFLNLFIVYSNLLIF